MKINIAAIYLYSVEKLYKIDFKYRLERDLNKKDSKQEENMCLHTLVFSATSTLTRSFLHQEGIISTYIIYLIQIFE